MTYAIWSVFKLIYVSAEQEKKFRVLFFKIKEIRADLDGEKENLKSDERTNSALKVSIETLQRQLMVANTNVTTMRDLDSRSKSLSYYNTAPTPSSAKKAVLPSSERSLSGQANNWALLWSRVFGFSPNPGILDIAKKPRSMQVKSYFGMEKYEMYSSGIQRPK